MNDDVYEDDRVACVQHDPRFDPLTGRLTLRLDATELVVRSEGVGTRRWPCKEVVAIERGILRDDKPDKIFGVRFWLRDPEGVASPGLEVAVECRNLYYAEVLAKRLSTACAVSSTKTMISSCDDISF